MLAEQTAGPVYQVHARRFSPYPGREAPTGVALDLATHDLDVIRYTTGSEVDRVYAETESHHEEGREDLVCASLRLGSGATGMIDVNWLTPTKVRQLSVTCEGGCS
jgi:predicted dehydrogenase